MILLYKIKDSVETTDNPFEGNESVFLELQKVEQRKEGRVKNTKADLR